MDILLLTGQIRTDGATQLRPQLTEEKIVEYADIWKTGSALFPSVEVCHDGKHYWLWDGFHRVEGARRAGVKFVKSRITAGSREHAQWLAYGANATHGLSRTNAEKRLAVERAIVHPEGIGKGDNAIAKHCHVSNHLVAEIRLTQQSKQTECENTGEKTESITEESSLTWNSPSQTENAPGNNGNIETEYGVDGEEEEPEEEMSPQPEMRTGADGRTINVSKIKAAAKARKLRVVPKPQKDLITHDRFNREIPPKLLYVFNGFAEAISKMRQHLIMAQSLWKEVEQQTQTEPFVTKHRNYLHFKTICDGWQQTIYNFGKDAPYCLCPNCVGMETECVTCEDAGWLAQMEYDGLPDRITQKHTGDIHAH